MMEKLVSISHWTLSAIPMVYVAKIVFEVMLVSRMISILESNTLHTLYSSILMNSEHESCGCLISSDIRDTLNLN